MLPLNNNALATLLLLKERPASSLKTVNLESEMGSCERNVCVNWNDINIRYVLAKMQEAFKGKVFLVLLCLSFAFYTAWLFVTVSDDAIATAVV